MQHPPALVKTPDLLNDFSVRKDGLGRMMTLCKIEDGCINRKLCHSGL